MPTQALAEHAAWRRGSAEPGVDGSREAEGLSLREAGPEGGPERDVAPAVGSRAGKLVSSSDYCNKGIYYRFPL